MPVDSLGACSGSWISVQAPMGARVGTGFAAVAGLLGLVIVIARQPIPGVALMVGALAAVVWLHARSPRGRVRLYERGFELERGSQHVAIAFDKLDSAILTTVEHKKYNVRYEWAHRLDLSWDTGKVTLEAVEPGRGPAPSSEFYEFARQVVQAHEQRRIFAG